MNWNFNNKWKPEATNSVVPSNSRPFHNGDPSLSTLGRVPFKPNPIKHWRKQLKPYYKTNSKQVSIQSIDAPGTATYLADKSISFDCDVDNYQLLKQNISLLNDCYGIRNSETNTCIGGTNHITRTANTVVKRNYHISHKKYLQSRCKTYERNQMLGEKIDDTTFHPVACSNIEANSCKKKITYKPSNRSFMQQGSTQASAFILKRRNMALTNNQASLKTAYGRAPIFKRDYKPGTTGYEIYYVKGNIEDTSTACSQTLKSCKKG
jgi:hypothetical protein